MRRWLLRRLGALSWLDEIQALARRAITENTFMRSRRARLLAAVGVVVAIGAAALVWVATTPTPPPPPTLADVQRQTDADLRQIIEGSIGSIEPRYSLEATPVQLLNCTGPYGEETGQTIVGVTYVLHGTDPARNDDYFLVLRAWLPVYGWDIRNDIHESKDRRFLNATHNGYLMSAQTDMRGGIFVGNSSPCVDRGAHP